MPQQPINSRIIASWTGANCQAMGAKTNIFFKISSHRCGRRRAGYSTVKGRCGSRPGNFPFRRFRRVCYIPICKSGIKRQRECSQTGYNPATATTRFGVGRRGNNLGCHRQLCGAGAHQIKINRDGSFVRGIQR